MPNDDGPNVFAGAVQCQLIVSIDRFVDEHQPGFVECSLMDANGTTHLFVEKIPVVAAEQLWKESNYPVPGFIACHIEEEVDGDNREGLVLVNTQLPRGIESTKGTTRFLVRPSQVQF